MRLFLSLLVLGGLVLLFGCSPKVGGKKSDLIWADEFSGHEPPDPAKWGYDLGGGGWGNNELQHYTNRPENAYLLNGKLVIEARKEDYEGNAYTSARLVTRNKMVFTGGRIEVRAKLPSG
ncbi:MAG: glycoside hydrolase family 16 protein, partial [Bacteroidota bacterium]